MKIPSLALFFLLLLYQGTLTADPDSDISITRESFSPSAGQSVRITFQVDSPGRIVAEILNLNQTVIRVLATETVKTGVYTYEWDGKDSKSATVKDGCYFPRIRYEVQKSKSPETFALKEVEIKPDYYDPLTGVLSYSLPQSSLVTVKALSHSHNKRTGDVNKKVQKVIVENAPRTKGKVIDYFDGYDDKGEYIPKSKYSISIKAQLLPANTIIVYGGSDLEGDL